jgi:DNA-binding NtrC family response regulator
MTYAARSDAKVLLTGESGVGKEVVARLIHAESARSHLPFVTLNCAGVPDSLLESELFGHVRGSFTDAFRDRAGLLEQANRGTILMDEVGEMSLRMQGLLLRFIETGELQRVGGDHRPVHVDVRVIAATNRNLVDRIAAGEFREDLYYRLNVVHIKLPPLRARREDIPLLLDHFLSAEAERYRVAVARPSPEALAALVEYDWPGNVRELKNLAERLVIRSSGGVITPAHLQQVLPRQRTKAPLAPVPGAVSNRADALFERMVNEGESFWKIVYEPFMSRDLTRDDLRTIIGRGLEQARGNYTILVQLFNMEGPDYKRFLTFLRQHDCHMPFKQYRTHFRTPGEPAPRKPARVTLAAREAVSPLAHTPPD